MSCVSLAFNALLLVSVCLIEPCSSLAIPQSKLAEGAYPVRTASSEVTVTISPVVQTGTDLHEFSIRTGKDMEKLRELSVLMDQMEVKIGPMSADYPTLSLKLKKAPTVLANGFIKKYFLLETGEPIKVAGGEDDSELANCFYTGHVNGMDDTYASISVCDGVDGVIKMLDKEYHITVELAKNQVVHHLGASAVDHGQEQLNCGTEDLLYNASSSKRFKRSVRAPVGSNVMTRYIEIYAVADKSFYEKAGSVEASIKRIINIVNYANRLYRQLNIYLALVGIEVWNSQNRIHYVRSAENVNVDSGRLLLEFNKYRQFSINYETPNDNGQLFTAESFENGLMGKGSTRGMCTQTDSGGVIYDSTSTNYIKAAITMAHILGHNLGLAHIDSKEYLNKDCGCVVDNVTALSNCIMHSSAIPNMPSQKWSQCTRDTLEQYFTENNVDHCLKNVPEKLLQVGSISTCGNFFVEEGEECDCGHPADCQSSCCDPTTCRFMPNATCATGKCCDLNTCMLRPYSYPCRPIQDAECDLVEACSGVSEWCPDDTYKQDGTECSNQGDAYCYNGKCRSHNSQCQKIWDGQNVRSSNEICYTAFNGMSQYYGNCGWDTVKKGYPSNSYSVGKTYKACQAEDDKFCGLLHCTRDSPRYLEAKILNLAMLTFKMSHNGHNCIISSFDVGYQEDDPGQVPNGAKCGENKMCVNSRCVEVPAISDECYCNGRGVCNQYGKCHCDSGWAPPFCKVDNIANTTLNCNFDVDLSVNTTDGIITNIEE